MAKNKKLVEEICYSEKGEYIFSNIDLILLSQEMLRSSKNFDPLQALLMTYEYNKKNVKKRSRKVCDAKSVF